MQEWTMATARMIRVLLISFVVRCYSEYTNGYDSNAFSVPQYGEILKPPPPPPSHSQILPVPFHRPPERHQRQNINTGYSYQPPPSPPSNLDLPTELNFPAPFYKQYNFNFVPPPQPFITTPSPSLYQKVTGWLFSQPSSTPSSNVAPSKKDCNPCNLVPWLPVIRYDLDAKNYKYNSNPTYGPPSPTAHNIVNLQNPQPFQSQTLPNLAPGLPNGRYSSPTSFDKVVSTYGPPSPTHTIGFATQKPQTSTKTILSSSYNPSSFYGLPGKSVKQINSQFSLQNSGYLTSNTPVSTYGISNNPYNEINSNSNIQPTNQPIINSATPASTYGVPYSSTSNYESQKSSKYVPKDVEIIRNIEPGNDHQMPKVSQPTGFKNSYGEPIENIFDLNIPYPVSATAAESTKVRTSVLPNNDIKYSTPNTSLALANPAPFSVNRGRNIHTLQPVALPNLSISPLPPIFNARPFRPIIPKFSTSLIQVVNQMQQSANAVKIEQSVPVAEYTHSVEYPTTIIQSPVIDIEATKTANLTKSFRNIQNGYIVDDIKDISPQASEDHVSTTKTNQDTSFESTGPEVGSDLYESNTPVEFKSKIAFNNNMHFADLSRLKDEDVDKYRTESNLQNIDSPLLYLKPSAPHKDFERFISNFPKKNYVNKEYEIYDDFTTTTTSSLPTRDIWDDLKSDYYDNFSLQTPLAQEDANKPKIVQIVIPYTLNKDENIDYKLGFEGWTNNPKDEYYARKVPTTSNTEGYIDSRIFTENYSTVSTTEGPETTATERYETTTLNTASILNDLYDVKEPPFDIIKLQHTIDDWTEQEFSNQYNKRNKYAKKIPEEYLTTMNPVYNYITVSNNQEYYDHEGSSSNHLSVIEDIDSTASKHFRQYNNIDRIKSYHSKVTDDEINNKHNKPLIYTAATSFRKSSTTTTTTTTPAPWGKIQTSISPLTNEKVYVVTSKPWRETYNSTNLLNKANLFESKKKNTSLDDFPFKSPRFSNRPLFDVTTSRITDSMETDPSYDFSNIWHQRINNLENGNNTTSWPDGSAHRITTINENDENINIRTSEEVR